MQLFVIKTFIIFLVKKINLSISENVNIGNFSSLPNAANTEYKKNLVEIIEDFFEEYYSISHINEAILSCHKNDSKWVLQGLKEKFNIKITIESLISLYLKNLLNKFPSSLKKLDSSQNYYYDGIKCIWAIHGIYYDISPLKINTEHLNDLILDYLRNFDANNYFTEEKVFKGQMENILKLLSKKIFFFIFL
ncbi:hypothetical protein GVAV_002410 [Gurleya vavrai]